VYLQFDGVVEAHKEIAVLEITWRLSIGTLRIYLPQACERH
jgi:hypothetical protein